MKERRERRDEGEERILTTLKRKGLGPKVLVGVSVVSLQGGWNTVAGPISESRLTELYDLMNFWRRLSTLLVSSLFLRSAPY